MKLDLNKTSLKDKILNSNTCIFIFCLVFSFIFVYSTGTLCFSFVRFELSEEVFNIDKWNIIIRFLFLFIWLVLTGLLFSENKK